VRIVVSVHDPPVWTIPPREVRRIAESLPGDEVVDAREDADRRREFPNADVLVATRLTADEFASAGRLRWIHTTAVGVGGLLPPAVVTSPIPVTNTRGVHSETIAEHAIALMLALRRRLHVAAARQAESRWAQEELVEAGARPFPPLSGAWLLVVGLGAIGRRVAAFGTGLGMRVIGIRRRVGEPLPPGVAEVFGPDRLKECLGRADAVILAVPRTGETRALIGEAEFGAMRPGAVLVNVARGGLVDATALERAVVAGRIAGAGLDAFVREPLPADSPLWRLPNVIVTPHSAAFGADYWAPAVDLFLENVGRFRRGETLLNLVDKVHGY
jgi:phosphoglycerate dehydrogenase-like enzyme